MSQGEMDAYRGLIRENICYDDFVRERPYDAAQLDEMVELVVEVVCSKKKNIRVAKNDFPPSGGEVPATEAGWGTHPLRVRLPPGKHRLGAEHEAVSADRAV